jgi:hypothetical protein
MASERYKLFPSPSFHNLINNARLAISEIRGDTNTWYYVNAKDRRQITTFVDTAVQPGLTLLTGIGGNRSLFIKVVNFHGEPVHQWNIDWHKIWSDATHVPEKMIPRGKPGTQIHGSRLMDNGDIVFNFENLGLVRLDPCGTTVFKVPYPTHHAIDVDEKGHFWLPGQTNYLSKLAEYPNYIPPFKDDTVVEISADGELLSEISIMALLRDNGYPGLMYLSVLKDKSTRVSGDVYHLNDVEVFPADLDEGVFQHGDIMLSLRNINTILVFNKHTRKIRYLSIGKFVRQHDPDFIDGNTISVYDNNHIAPASFGHSSRIVILSALNDQLTTYISGSEELPFYSRKMGKHQWLENGNLLILEAMNGRLLEISPDKKLVWDYNNIIDQTGVVGIMEGAERLSKKFDESFFAQKRAACQEKQQ